MGYTLYAIVRREIFRFPDFSPCRAFSGIPHPLPCDWIPPTLFVDPGVNDAIWRGIQPGPGFHWRAAVTRPICTTLYNSYLHAFTNDYSVDRMGCIVRFPGESEALPLRRTYTRRRGKYLTVHSNDTDSLILVQQWERDSLVFVRISAISGRK
jgi:hypothetical protein